MKLNKRILTKVIIARVLVAFIITTYLFFPASVIYVAATSNQDVEAPTIDSTNSEFSSEHVIAPTSSTEPTNFTELTEPTEPIQLIEDPILFSGLVYEGPTYDIISSESFKTTLVESIAVLNEALASNEYSEFAVGLMQAEIFRLNEIILQLDMDISTYSKWEQEHFYAAKTYEFFKQKGFSDAVICGIIGNMMIETSGGTLDLKPTVYGQYRGFYGLCQWSLYYRPNVADMSFEDQLVYLYNDLDEEFNVFGFCYKQGFGYEDFLQLDSPRDAAIAFAKVYERPGAGTYTLRANCAEVAYEYFVPPAH